MRSSSARRRRWAAITSGPYSTKLPGSTRSSTFSRAVRWPVLAAPGDGVGPAVVEADGVALDAPRRGRAGARRRSTRPRVGVDAALDVAPASTSTSGSPGCTVSPDGDGDRARRRPPPSAATTCSIFIDSMTTQRLAGADVRRPAPTSTDTTVPCIGRRHRLHQREARAGYARSVRCRERKVSDVSISSGGTAAWAPG